MVVGYSNPAAPAPAVLVAGSAILVAPAPAVLVALAADPGSFAEDHLVQLWH